VLIGELARRTETTTKALRYYERLGVLCPERGEQGYRRYAERDVRTVRLIRSLAQVGISVDRSRPFLECLDLGHEHPDDCVASLASYRRAIAELDARMAGLARMRDELAERLERAAARQPDPEPRPQERPVTSYDHLPSDLPAPTDDGAADHLPGLRLPELGLPATDGTTVDLQALPGRAVLYLYPLSGRPGVDLPDGWDAIPGARGCTPESCGFRDHFAELRAAGAGAVYGLSSQDSDYQAELADRLGLPFPILSDEPLALADALRLPTFEADGRRRYSRLTLVVDAGRVTHAFYPIFRPDRHAAQVLAWLRAHPPTETVR
jgi:peroxiredoxin/DNA-binding transcriptional MerR regulator